MEPVEFKNEAWEMIRTITNQMDSLFRACYETYGLTVGQARILFLLRREKKISMTALSRLLNVTPGNLSVTCKRLEKAGLLMRQRNKEDERVVLLSLTEKGGETLNRLRERLESQCGEILGEISESDLDIMVKGMKLMSEVLNRAGHKST